MAAEAAWGQGVPGSGAGARQCRCLALDPTNQVAAGFVMWEELERLVSLTADMPLWPLWRSGQSVGPWTEGSQA